jgi:hypothetical protein
VTFGAGTAATEGARALALAQGLYFGATGLWPVLHLRSFEIVTGPKPEGWLVKTVGSLLTVIGVALVATSRRRAVGREWALLAGGSAAALAAVDVWYAGVRRRISPVYLADAPIEIALAAGWVTVRRGLA